jgi:hypothetical protein
MNQANSRPETSANATDTASNRDDPGQAAAVAVLGVPDDHERVAALAAALQRHGLDVVAQSGAPAEAALAAESARCVVIFWSQAALAAHGSAIRSLADYARDRHNLVSVLGDPVVPTVSMGEQPALDLTQWDGQSADGAFRDVLAAVQARLKGKPLPAAKVPLWAARKARFGRSILGLTVFLLVAFALDLFHLQRKVCYLPINQPELADACGAWGLGEMPSREERLAWAAREVGSCDDLRRHLEKFPNGAFKYKAADWLSQPRRERTAEFVSVVREAPGYVNAPDEGVGDEARAQRLALARAESDAEEFLCHSVEQDNTLEDVKVVIGKFDCRLREKGGHACGLEYTAQCKVKARMLRERCG